MNDHRERSRYDRDRADFEREEIRQYIRESIKSNTVKMVDSLKKL